MPVMNVPVTKAKAMIEVDTDKLSDDVLREIYLQGLKVLLNRGASKITAATIADEDTRKSEAMLAAEKQLEAIYAGTIKFTGGKAKKASGAVMTEARRIAKALIKDDLKARGFKISHYEASDITKAANVLLDSDQGKEIIAQAEANLQERSKTPVGIDVSAIISESPKLVEKAEAAKAKKKSQLSAKQAGMTTKRKPQAAGKGANA